MQKDFKNLFKHSSIYTIGNVLKMSIGIILVPLYTMYIKVSDFGIYSIFSVTIQFLPQLLLLGLFQASLRWYSLKNEKQGSILFTTLFYTIVVHLLLLLIMTYGVNVFNSYHQINVQIKAILYLFPIIIGLNLHEYLLTSFFMHKQMSIGFVVIMLLNVFIQLVVTIFLVAYRQMGILGIFYGQTFGLALSVVLKFIVVRKYLVFYLDFNEFREMIKFGYPLSISTVSKNFLEISDRYILSGLTNMAVVGCYDLGYKFAKLVKNIMINSFHISLKPILWEKVKDNNFSEFHTKVITYYSILITWIALFLTIFAKEIIYGFSKNSDYFSAYKIIGLVTFAISIKGLFPLFRIIFEIKQKTKYIPFIVTFAGILNIILNIILIPKFEMMGAAYSLFISYLLIIIFSFYFSNKLMHIKIEFRKIVSIVLSSICLIIFAKIIFDFPFIYRIFLKIIFIVSYPILLYLLKVFDRKEIAIIKDVLKNTKL